MSLYLEDSLNSRALGTSTALQSRGRLSLWAIASGYLLIHAIVATCLPDRLAPLSTFCIVLAEVAAVAVSLRASRNVPHPMRAFWLLLVCSILLHTTAMSLDIVSEATHMPVFNYVPVFQIFFSMLYGVPLLFAVSLPSDERSWGVARLINTLLAIATGVVLYLQLFALLSRNGSSNPNDAVFIARLFDGIDLFLAISATIRWPGAAELQESRFFRILSYFLWANAILPAIHNRVLVQHDYIWLDLLISAPYVFLSIMVLSERPHAIEPASPAFVRAVRTGTPIFLTLALVFVGTIAIRSHFYVGMAAVFFAIAGYGTLNVVLQSKGLAAEESLLTSKQTLEKLVGLDSLTGIPNRWAFDKVLERDFAAARRTNLPCSLLMIDVDHFKQLNDQMGHQAGDEYLVCIANAMKSALPRVTDFVARYGGEEFSAILPATDSAGAAKTAARLRETIAALALRHPNTSSGIVTVSIGFSTFDGSSQHAASNLVRVADRALYVAKRHGRNRAEFLPLTGRA